MDKKSNYGVIFEDLIQKTQDYIVNNNLKCMVLGISGGIDSTVVAAICHEVSKRTYIPLYGRSLPTKFNKSEEINSAILVGKSFCDDFEEIPIKSVLDSASELFKNEGMTPLSLGNIQARIRMMYLYHLASIKGGVVMDTDNLTENNLGYFTIHGDVGDLNPIGGLWKTEVFKLATWIHNEYYNKARCLEEGHFYEEVDEISLKLKAIEASLSLMPTAGLGITNSDLEEIGAESYEQVDNILDNILSWEKENEKLLSNKKSIEKIELYLKDVSIKDIPFNIIENVTERHFKSEFKRKKLPIKL